MAKDIIESVKNAARNKLEKSQNTELYRKECKVRLTTNFILICVILVFAGCTMTKITLPDGTTIHRHRFMQDESFNVSYDNGNFVIEDYDSETAEIVAAAVRAALGGGI